MAGETRQPGRLRGAVGIAKFGSRGGLPPRQRSTSHASGNLPDPERADRDASDLMTMRVDFTSQEFFRNPAAGIERLRACGPVVETRFPIVGRVWITTTYDATARVLKDSTTFTLRKDGSPAGLRWWMPAFVGALANNMLTVDEPDH